MLHTLTRSLRENKGPALVTVLLSALEVVFEIVIPLFMSNLIDFGIEGGSMAAVWKFGAFLLLLAAFLCYVFCCAISVCAVVWLLSEMYPIRVRGVAMSIAGFSLWTGTYLVGQLTPWMLANLTPAGTFFLFAAMCVPYMLLIWKAVPEMSGRTLEEIERYWTR